MKITITAGIKTINISNAIEERLNASGDSLVTLPSLGELEEYIECGYKIDRVVIIEQALTDDGSLSSQTEIRNRVNDISNIITNREKDAEVVILTRYDELADLIYEESLSIRAKSCIIVKDRPYSTSFFVNITTSDINSIDDSLIYKPKADVQWEENESTEEIEETEDEWDLDYENNDMSISGIVETDDEWDMDSGDYTQDSDKITHSENMGYNTSFGEIKSDICQEEQEYSDSISNSIEDTWDESSYDKTQHEEEPKVDGKDEWDDDLFLSDNRELNDNLTADELDTDTANNIEDNWDDEKSYSEYEEGSGNSISNEQCEYNEDEQNSIQDEWTSNEDEWENSENEVETNESNREEWVDEVYSEEATDEHEEVYNDTEENIDEIYKQNEEETRRNKGSVSTGFIGGRRSREQRQKSNDGIKIDIDGGITTSELSHRMESFASRGNTIVMTGSGGTGTSILVLNMANAISKLGYSVIIVDMDTKHRAQSYISKEAYNALEPDTSDLISAVNSGAPVERFSKIIRPGIHLLSLWMGGDCAKASEVISKDKITRFMNYIKTSYNFAIYDMTFEDATGFLRDIMFTADNIVNVVDSSNWGITKFMLDYCNIQHEDVQEAMFNRTELIFNKFEDINTIMGRKVKKLTDILKILDNKVIDLTGVDSGLYFSNMHIAGAIKYSRMFESNWYNDKWVSDSKEGKERFIRLVAETVLY